MLPLPSIKLINLFLREGRAQITHFRSPAARETDLLFNSVLWAAGKNTPAGELTGPSGALTDYWSGGLNPIPFRAVG